MKTEMEVRKERCYTDGFEVGGSGYVISTLSSLQKLEKGKK